MEHLYEKDPLIQKIAAAEEICWINEKKRSWESARDQLPVTAEEIEDARERLDRFAPFIRKCFPETEPENGRIESVLTPIPGMQKERFCIPGIFLSLSRHLRGGKCVHGWSEVRSHRYWI